MSTFWIVITSAWVAVGIAIIASAFYLGRKDNAGLSGPEPMLPLLVPFVPEQQPHLRPDDDALSDPPPSPNDPAS